MTHATKISSGHDLHIFLKHTTNKVQVLIDVSTISQVITIIAFLTIYGIEETV